MKGISFLPYYVSLFCLTFLSFLTLTSRGFQPPFSFGPRPTRLYYDGRIIAVVSKCIVLGDPPGDPTPWKKRLCDPRLGHSNPVLDLARPDLARDNPPIKLPRPIFAVPTTYLWGHHDPSFGLPWPIFWVTMTHLLGHHDPFLGSPWPIFGVTGAHLWRSLWPFFGVTATHLWGHRDPPLVGIWLKPLLQLWFLSASRDVHKKDKKNRAFSLSLSFKKRNKAAAIFPKEKKASSLSLSLSLLSRSICARIYCEGQGALLGKGEEREGGERGPFKGEREEEKKTFCRTFNEKFTTIFTSFPFPPLNFFLNKKKARKGFQIHCYGKSPWVAKNNSLFFFSLSFPFLPQHTYLLLSRANGAAMMLIDANPPLIY